MAEQPVSRQMGCPLCGHEHLWLDCDFCSCTAHERPGIYPQEVPMTTGFMPDALDRNIPPGSNDPAIEPCGVVCHVRDGLGDSLHDFFNGPSGGVESHFYVRFDGVIEQYRSIFFEADANLDGNRFTLGGRTVGFVSIETEGLASGEWTPAQLASIKRIILWVRSQQSFPLRVCPAWNEPGVGYHVMWGSPSHWTPSVKTCPGPDRIKQFNAVLVPWMADPTLEEDMTPEELRTELDAFKKELLNDLGQAKIAWPFAGDAAPISLDQLAESLVNRTKPLDLDALAAKIAARVTVTPIDEATLEAAVMAVAKAIAAKAAG